MTPATKPAKLSMLLIAGLCVTAWAFACAAHRFHSALAFTVVFLCAAFMLLLSQVE